MKEIGEQLKPSYDELAEELRVGRLVTQDTVELDLTPFYPANESWRRTNFGYVEPFPDFNPPQLPEADDDIDPITRKRKWKRN